MKKLAVAAVLAGLATFAVNLVMTAAATDMLPGTYTCTGTQPDGKKYEDTFDLSVKAEGADTYMVVWSHQGQPMVAGLGIHKGDSLAVMMFGGMQGVALYHITPGRLDGVWSPEPGKRGTERCQAGKSA
jgi:hypothetical protein